MTMLVCRKNNCLPKITYLVKIPFKSESKIHRFFTQKSWENQLPTDLYQKKC